MAKHQTPDTKTPKILITAGEPSGDRLGAALMAELKKLNSNIRFIGTGGEQMIGQGLTPLFPMSDLAVMGLFEVIPAIPRILTRIQQLTALAQTEKPDLIITIDSQDFSKRLAKSIRQAHIKSSYPHTLIPHIHYVAPKVWAWRPHRVKKLPALYTHLLTILPFEEKFFSKAGLPATYVGHPAVTTLASYKQPDTRHQGTKTPVLALLPGSRMAELKRHWPIFLDTYRQLRQIHPNLTGVLALPSEKSLAACRTLAAWGEGDKITATIGESRFPPLAAASAALTKSGTNNLEIALLGVPAIVCYRMNSLTYVIAKHLVKIPYISLPNIILHESGQKPTYPEYIQSAVTAKNLVPALSQILTKPTQNAALQTFQNLMQTPKPPAQLAAQVVSKYLK